MPEILCCSCVNLFIGVAQNNEHMVIKMGIDSSYIRGFFDAEGWVDPKGRQIGIVNTNLSILHDIYQFLLEHGIDSKISKHSKPAPSRRQCYVLRICGYHNILGFKETIGSNFVDKTEKLERAILTYRYKIFSREELSRIVELRSQGLTYEKIAGRLGSRKGTVWAAYRVISKGVIT